MRARFIDPMLLQRVEALPEGPEWQYELKLDGYRALAFKTGGVTHLRSRNDHDFSRRYAGVMTGLVNLPDDTLVDGELVALDQDGRPSFSALQHAGGAASLQYYVFDLLMIRGADVTRRPLSERRAMLEAEVLPLLGEPVRYAAPIDASLADLVFSVREQGLEGLVAKRTDSRYEPGLRSGAWRKMRVNRGEAFVIGGYTTGASPFDALIFGQYDGGTLLYVARTRSGFAPATRRAIFRKLQPLQRATCPFANLPEQRAGRWGQGLTKAKMADCRWVEPVLVAQIEFVEWTPDRHLRHSRFVALRDDTRAADVRRE
jgi:bifunctional non-homologous end joining protein LigD